MFPKGLARFSIRCLCHIDMGNTGMFLFISLFHLSSIQTYLQYGSNNFYSILVEDKLDGSIISVMRRLYFKSSICSLLPVFLINAGNVDIASNE